MHRHIGLSASFMLLVGCISAAPPEGAPVAVEQTSKSRPGVEQPAREIAAPGQRQRVLYGSGEMQVRGYLQDVVSDRFGNEAWSAFSAARTAVAVASIGGRWATNHDPAVNFLMKTESGWVGHRGGTRRAVSAEVARELDNLIGSGTLWSEPNRYPAVACPDSGADVIIVRHRGRTKTVYQSGGCGTPNLSSRLIHTALGEQLPG